jgi:hypothetical protein
MTHRPYRTALLGILIWGCSGYDDLEATEGDAELGEEYGTLTQGYSAKGSSTFTYGTRTASQAGACTRTGSGQVCYVPTTKAVTWNFGFRNGVTQADADRVLLKAIAVFDLLTSALGADGWSFAKVPDTANIQIIAGLFECPGSTQPNIDGYVCQTSLNLSQAELSENLPGAYKENFNTSLEVDIGDITVQGNSATQESNLLHHALMHGVLAHIGIGSNSLQGTNCSRRAIIPDATCNTMRPGELCRAKSFAASGTSFALTTPNCVD